MLSPRFCHITAQWSCLLQQNKMFHRSLCRCTGKTSRVLPFGLADPALQNQSLSHPFRHLQHGSKDILLSCKSLTQNLPNKLKCLKLRGRRGSLNAILAASAPFPRLGYTFGFFTVLNAFYEGSQHSRYCTNVFLLYCVCSAWLQQQVLLLL